MAKEVLDAKNAHDSVGGSVRLRARGVPPGLGEPLYGRLDAKLAEAMMGINAAKAVEIGSGEAAAAMRGSAHNDPMQGLGVFESNHAGGILGGMSSGAPIEMTVHFKPTPSIFREQQTVNTSGEAVTMAIKGRHDPCVAIRGAVVAEAMMALVLADMLLLNLGSRMDHLKTIYQGGQ